MAGNTSTISVTLTSFVALFGSKFKNKVVVSLVILFKKDQM